MKKIACLLVIISSLTLPVVAHALGGLEKTANKAGFEENDLIKISGNVLNVILSFVGVLFLVMMLAGGFIWMTASGRPERVSVAQKLIVAGVIGLVIVVSAYAITTFIGDSLNLENESSPTVPIIISI